MIPVFSIFDLVVVSKCYNIAASYHCRHIIKLSGVTFFALNETNIYALIFEFVSIFLQVNIYYIVEIDTQKV